MRDLGFLEMDEVDSCGGVSVGLNRGCSNIISTILNHAREIAVVSGIF